MLYHYQFIIEILQYYKPMHLGFLFFASIIVLSTGSEAAQPTLSKCEISCNNDQQCMKMCQQSRSQSIQQVLSITLAFVLSFLFCCSLCFILKHHRCRKFRLLFNPHFRNLNTKFGNGSSGVIGGLQFIQHLRNFVNIINQSVDYESFINIQDGVQKYQKAVVTAQHVNSQCYSIQLKGEDNEGDWSASGAIVSTNQGVICWFLKEYDEDLRRGSRDSAGQYIYISDPSNLEGISGRWQGVEKRKQRKGEWRIKKQVQSQLKQSESHMQIMN